jgi:hypothetical protein
MERSDSLVSVGTGTRNGLREVIIFESVKSSKKKGSKDEYWVEI